MSDPSANLSIIDLTARSCRWIVGDPRKPLEPIYCGRAGADLANDEPYCQCHRAMAGNGLGRDLSKFKAA